MDSTAPQLREWLAEITIAAGGPPAAEEYEAVHAALGTGFSSAGFTPPDHLNIGYRVTAEGLTAAYIAVIGPLHRAAAALPGLVGLERLQRLTLSVFPSGEQAARWPVLPSGEPQAGVDGPGRPSAKLRALLAPPGEAGARTGQAEEMAGP